MHTYAAPNLTQQLLVITQTHFFVPHKFELIAINEKKKKKRGMNKSGHLLKAFRWAAI